MPTMILDSPGMIAMLLSALTMGLGVAITVLAVSGLSLVLLPFIACVIVTIAALAWANWSTSKLTGAFIAVLALGCIAAVIIVGNDDDVNTPVYLGMAIPFVVLQSTIAAFIWYRRAKLRQRHQLESLPVLETSYSHTPYNYNGILTPQGGLPVRNDMANNPRSYSGLWDDDVITAARIPREQLSIKHLLSRGGYGEVYVGSYNDRAVAVKMLLPEMRKNLDRVNAFLAEAKLSARMNHLHIVTFVGVAWDSLADLCVALEFMEGGDLRNLLAKYDRERHPVGFDAAKIKVALHVALALAYLHSLESPVIHRDLKSNNVLLDADLNAKVTDFGESRERANRTMTAEKGTLLWMAPEVLLGQRYDHKADVFSFGVLLSELDVQKLPYSHAQEVRDSGTGRRKPDTVILQLVALARLRVEFSPEALSPIVELGNACVSLDPTERPSAAEVAAKLQTVLENEVRNG